MSPSAAQSAKLAIVSATGLSKDALHIYAGLLILLSAAFITRSQLRSLKPWLAVLFVTAIGEVIDMRDDLLSLGYWRWSACLHDMVNTLIWPTVLVLLARFTQLFGVSRETS